MGVESFSMQLLSVSRTGPLLVDLPGCTLIFPWATGHSFGRCTGFDAVLASAAASRRLDDLFILGDGLRLVCW